MRIVAALLLLTLLAACADQTEPRIRTHLNGVYSTGVIGTVR